VGYTSGGKSKTRWWNQKKRLSRRKKAGTCMMKGGEGKGSRDYPFGESERKEKKGKSACSHKGVQPALCRREEEGKRNPVLDRGGGKRKGEISLFLEEEREGSTK